MCTSLKMRPVSASPTFWHSHKAHQPTLIFMGYIYEEEETRVIWFPPGGSLGLSLILKGSAKILYRKYMALFKRKVIQLRGINLGPLDARNWAMCQELCHWTGEWPESGTPIVPDSGQDLACSDLHNHKIRLLSHCSVSNSCMLRFEGGNGF